MPRTILADTGYWLAICDPRDRYHNDAKQKQGVVGLSKLLLPWPCLYETFNTRFSKNTMAIERFDTVLRRGHVVLLPDEAYRDAALDIAIRGAQKRSLALVDVIIRLILDDINVRKDGMLTFNHGDFSDLCRKHQIEML